MTQTTKIISSLIFAGILRYFLIISTYSAAIRDRVEVSTPINSWKRVEEGAFLYSKGIDPYHGDIYHKSPLMLVASSYLIKNWANIIPILFVFLDLLTGVLLYFMAKGTFNELFTGEQSIKEKFSEDTEEIQLKQDDGESIPLYTTVSYLFNPYSILNCVGQTTTVWSNFLLALFFFGITKRSKLLTVVALAMETQNNFYPFILIVPAVLAFTKESKNKLAEGGFLIALYIAMIAGLNWISFKITGNWSFVNSTLGFIIYYRDLQPNIGLFWYFFTEMFDHFRTLFLYTFQINATILYLFPLTFKLRNNPMLLATLLTALVAIFKSYPCVGDLALYMAMIPMWKCITKFMTHNFIVGATFLVTSVLAPVVWYLWIYSGSANANFYFGVTLVFATAQIFLVTDLFFANIKRSFCLQHGMTFVLDGKEAKMALE